MGNGFDGDPPPDLEEFVRHHGGIYSAISTQAWAEWDRLNAAWQMCRFIRRHSPSAPNAPPQRLRLPAA